MLHARYIEFVELFLDPRYLIDFQEEVALLVELPVGWKPLQLLLGFDETRRLYKGAHYGQEENSEIVEGYQGSDLSSQVLPDGIDFAFVTLLVGLLVVVMNAKLLSVNEAKSQKKVLVNFESHCLVLGSHVVQGEILP